MKELNALLAALPAVRVGVLGDFCLDVYWTMDHSASELSVETGLPTRPARHQRYELGGAGTIVNNLLAMGVRQVAVFGVVGADPFGRELQRLLTERGIDSRGLLTQATSWDTPVFLKPIRDDREENRIDFGNFNQLHDTVGAALLARLAAALDELQVVIVNQQIVRGIHTAFVQPALNRLIHERADKPFVVDCRHLVTAYSGCLHRLNDVEATRACGATRQPGDVIPREETSAAARQLFERWQKPVFVSRGDRGGLVVDATGEHVIPGLHILNPTDPVGAGDSMLAGIAAALAAGASPREAAEFGNFVAGVTIQKLFQTGTASPEEIRAIGSAPDYVYEPR